MSSDTTHSDSTESFESVPNEQVQMAAEVETLREENAKLRREYARARRVRNRNAAVGLAVVGVVAVLGAVLLLSVRTILLVLGATGLFTATLVYYLEPTRVLPVNISEAVYDTLAANESALVAELGLDGKSRYYPTDEPGTSSVVLFVTRETDESPSRPQTESLLVISNETNAHGVALQPSGVPLLNAFRKSVSSDLGETPTDLAEQLSEAAETLGIVDAVSFTLDTKSNSLTVGVSEPVYGDLTQFDHPVVSFFAVGLAARLDEPVCIESVESADRADAAVNYRWGA
ncbi:hypothetical protein [Haladaptatus cibarius]|uniref:hypothetical protein n=1 Tax=Haladaptatus cibarius TaxID=453847 RepID=UPI000679A5C8|nr:hypothetical protein [Haladaptatus cibarius]